MSQKGVKYYLMISCEGENEEIFIPCYKISSVITQHYVILYVYFNSDALRYNLYMMKMAKGNISIKITILLSNLLTYSYIHLKFS